MRRGVMFLLAAGVTAAAVLTIVNTVDVGTLRLALNGILEHMPVTVLSLACYAAAILLRSWAWRRVLPGLPLGQAFAALNIAAGANQVLPFRLGEPLRVVSVVRRTDTGPGPATATTITLRAADVLGLLAILATVGTVVVGVGGVEALASPQLRIAAIVFVALLAAGLAWSVVLRGRGSVRLPGSAVLAAGLGAWGLESVVLWVVAGNAGIGLNLFEAVLVAAAAGAAQPLAVAPGGLGSYEAGAVAALALLGVPPGTALAIAVITHALGAVYAVSAGSVGLFLPGPSIFGRLTLGERTPLPAAPERVREKLRRPIVVVLPAHNEAESIAAVIGRIPPNVLERPVRVLVVDDGSTDATASQALHAGARVLGHQRSYGLGASARTGLRAALDDDPGAVVLLHADGEYRPEELERLVIPVVSGRADYIVGSRFTGAIRHMRPLRRLANALVTFAMRAITGEPVTDGQSGFRALSRRAAATAMISHDYSYAEVLTLDLLQQGYAYNEVPVTCAFGHRRSSLRLVPYLRHVVPTVHRELNGQNGTRPHPQPGRRKDPVLLRPAYAPFG